MCSVVSVACKVDHCVRNVRTRGLCARHYTRWYDARPIMVNGKPLAPFEKLPSEDSIYCECAEPDPKAGPLTWAAVAHGPLPNECLRCGLPVYEALVASLDELAVAARVGRPGR